MTSTSADSDVPSSSSNNGTKSVLVSGLPHSESESNGNRDWIREWFRDVKTVRRFLDDNANGPNGHAVTAHVTFSDARAAHRALELDGMPLEGGGLLRVTLATLPLTSDDSERPLIQIKRRPFLNLIQCISGSKTRYGRNPSHTTSGDGGFPTSGNSNTPPVHRVICHLTEPKLNRDPTIFDGEDLQPLFDLQRFPNVMDAIFNSLDAVSLLRCRLVSRNWNHIVQKIVLEKGRNRRLLHSRWKTGLCSMIPLVRNPEINASSDSSTKYRNVLSLKADALEIHVALDNGNVEIYDRAALKLTHTIAGKKSVSPGLLEISKDLIVVEYTVSFVLPIGSRWKTKRSSEPHWDKNWWKIFSRRDKRLLRTIDKSKVCLHSTDVSTVKSEKCPAAGCLMGASDIRAGPSNLIYLHNQQHVFSLDFGQSFACNEDQLYEAIQRNELNVWHLASVNWPQVNLRNPDTIIEGFDLDTNFVAVAVKEVLGGKCCLYIYKQKDRWNDNEVDSQIMDRLVFKVNLFDPEDGEVDDEVSCHADDVQFVYPLCLVRVSNNKGSFEHVSSRGKPFVVFKFVHLERQCVLRSIVINDSWMRTMSDVLVRYDSDTSLLSSKFNSRYLVVGFGSFSAPDDGGIAIWDISGICHSSSIEWDEAQTLDPPTFHWEPWDSHCGGISFIHLDLFGIIAANSCVHRIASKCVEPGDHSLKDNILVYDFWKIGIDERRPQRHQQVQHELDDDNIFAQAIY